MGFPANGFRAAVITFPGSNCDRDMAVALEAVTATPAIRVWHGDADLPDNLDFIALPGGFSYGDVLGAGEGWAKSILYNESVRAVFASFFERADTFTLGVCNGCQMVSALKELIPGAAHWPRFVRSGEISV